MCRRNRQKTVVNGPSSVPVRMNCQTNRRTPLSKWPVRKHVLAAGLCFLVGRTGGAATAVAQEPVQAEKPPATAQAATGAIRIFLDCNYSCDESYIKQEITFVDYMRDRRDADVHILL